MAEDQMRDVSPTTTTQVASTAQRVGARLTDELVLPCGQVLANRLMKAALSEALGNSAHDPTERLVTLYRRWASGGFGLIVTGNVMVDRRQLGEPGNVVVEDKRAFDALRRWADAARAAGTPTWMQINHPGRNANPLATGNRPVAPSAVRLKIPGMATPRALSSQEIEEILDRFVVTAGVAESAGFDGVQIHGAHGYLLAQFLSPLANQRDDEWGGDPQRRMRFAIEVTRRIRAAVSPGFAVGIKLNSADFQRGGFTAEQSREVMSALAHEGLDLIEISGGTYEAPAMMGKSRTASRTASTIEREAYFLEYAYAARGLVGTVPLAVTGGFRSHAAMAEAVSSGTCDIVGLGRPTCIAPEAATQVLSSPQSRLRAVPVQIGMRAAVGRVADLKMLDGAVELQWHTDQLHRMGDGKEPDLGRSWRRTLVTMVTRNGLGSLRRKRS